MRVIAPVLAFALALPGAPAAADSTSALLAQLERCDAATISRTGPRLDLLLALADGRSAVDVANLLRDPRPCLGRVSAYGAGNEEIVLVGGAGDALGATGALLWVDRGYWRIAALPLGYAPGTRGPTIRADGKEYFIGITSGGSSGWIGLAAVTVRGAAARMTLRFDFGGELRDMRLLEDGRLYVEGRRTTDRAFTWSTHPDWPYGAQWLFERSAGAWNLVAQRQAVTPHFLLTGFVGGWRRGDIATMSRFASPAIVADALTLPAPPTEGYIDLHGTYAALLTDHELTRRETLSWDALPEGIRTAPPDRTHTTLVTFPAAGPGRPRRVRV